MDTQTAQTLGNGNMKEQKEKNDAKWAKAAKVAGAATAAAGVAAVAASVLDNNDNVSPADDETLAQVELDEAQGLQEQVETPEAPQATSVDEHVSNVNAADSASAPIHTQDPVVHNDTPTHTDIHSNVNHAPQHGSHSVPESPSFTEVQMPSQAGNDALAANDADIPVDAQWLAHDDNQHEQVSNEPTPADTQAQTLNQELPPISQSAMNILNSSVGDELADKVNVSPEIFTSMMGLQPTDMIHTELNGDGQAHMAALLANDNGQYVLLVDSDGDGFLDTLTDMTGNEYAMLEGGIHFEINVSDMQAYVNEINPETMLDNSMYATNDVNVASIEGEGDGDDIAFVDEHDIHDLSQVNEAMTDNSNDMAQDVIVDDDLDFIDDDIDSSDADLDADIIGYDDSTMA